MCVDAIGDPRWWLRRKAIGGLRDVVQLGFIGATRDIMPR
jgi:hypothetical protein